MKENKEELKEILRIKSGYLKKGSQWLSDKFDVTIEQAREAVREVKNDLKEVVEEFEEFDKEDAEVQDRVTSKLEKINSYKDEFKTGV